ncbi:MAG TPA: hypothetical protein VEO73_09075 [Gemmatimonadales bacterium]|nr:hypothetical protein [Gemmatimonadales bacterium]
MQLLRRLGAAVALAGLTTSVSSAPAADLDFKSLYVTAAEFRTVYNETVPSLKEGVLLPRFAETPDNGGVRALYASPVPYITITLVVSSPAEVIQSVTLALGQDGTARGEDVRIAALVSGLRAGAVLLSKADLKVVGDAISGDQGNGAVWGGKTVRCGYEIRWARTPGSALFIQMSRQQGAPLGCRAASGANLKTGHSVPTRDSAPGPAQRHGVPGGQAER